MKSLKELGYDKTESNDDFTKYEKPLDFGDREHIVIDKKDKSYACWRENVLTEEIVWSIIDVEKHNAIHQELISLDIIYQ